MATWEQTTLDKLGILQSGKKTHKPASDPVLFENGTVPFVQVWCVKNNLFVRNVEKNYNEIGKKQSRLFPASTVCITNNGRIGDASILLEDSCLADTLFGFSSFENVSDPKFMKYCFNFGKIKKLCEYVASANTGTKALTIERLKKIPFPNPPLELQQKIGKILSTYDLLIENYQSQIEEAKKQVVWKMIHTS
ncbi:hypothetical protein A6V39_01785 [Candidatus Mycoplasma haematobovis]|uniref:Type I restriction modification DNA specificity domain-containing protein n=1 Tax=Candidatus Mycoplasma haematobovis TaxID=432608 RepID=A0A1A9QF59_9MOLU|nr:restriction endonuclease subunit S [Candidatus Mycoplasma haematobovis]OAL10774.1 hypothetical protein A6V39_01785 [Candidatus Mycoplasma haematobovis]